jgi:2-oxo-hept-3-ene-1,7-dioate hydratase
LPKLIATSRRYLISTEKERKQAIQLSKTWPDLTIDDSCAISREVARRKLGAGAKLIGHKVGLTSRLCSGPRRSMSPTTDICSTP